jgi:dTDP-4-amino-4,6-dideoxy-D-galactose acyltransferase
MTSLVRFLEWDSAHFGVRLGRLQATTLALDSAMAVVEEMRRERIDCTYCFFDANDRSSCHAAEQGGARQVDLRMSYELDLLRAPKIEARPDIRSATASDIPALERIAETAHRDSRFYFDGRFEEAKVNDLYRIWIRKSVARTFADEVLTIDIEAVPAGYVTLSMKETEAEIGLIAVADSARGGGIGRALVQAAISTTIQRGAKRLSVVTQGRNAAAQRLYQRAGFTIRDALALFHLWR